MPKKIGIIKDNIHKSQEQTSLNIKLALERGEKLNEMSQKADTIKESAQAFHREAGKVKSQMFWQKWRWIIIGGIVAAVLITAIVLFCIYVI